MRLRPSYLAVLPPLYLLAAFLLGGWMAPLPDDAWERAWLPAVVGTLAAVYLPTTAWLARRAGTRWMGTTMLNAAVGHALTALLLFGLTLHDLGRPRPSEGGLQFDVALTLPGSVVETVVGVSAMLVAVAGLAGLLAVPVGRVARAVARPGGRRPSALPG